MKKKWRKMSHDLAWCAIDTCFKGKWHRNDVLTFIEEWAGIGREEIWQMEIDQGEIPYKVKYEIMEEIAMMAEDMIEGICRGEDPELLPAEIHPRPDGASGKIRNVAYLCLKHQILGHMVKIGLEPLLNARILPCQHASIPGRGQTGLSRQIRRTLHRAFGAKYFVKTDCTQAYASIQYDMVIKILESEIPEAEWIMKSMQILRDIAPGNHLIIGGYLDAWLFNLVMSYCLRYALSLYKRRRDKRIPLVLAASCYMDDVALLGRSRADLKTASRKMREWMAENCNVRQRNTTDILIIYPVSDEKRRKRKARPAARGCPMVDMGGYRICRSHTSIRRRNAKRAIRCFQRAWKEYRKTGTVKRQRAGQIIARYGMISNMDGYRFCEKYHVYETLRVAKRVQGYWARQARRKRRENLKDAARKYREFYQAGFGED